MLSLEGKQLGNYDVIRRIRIGGMGAVYEGRQRTAFDRRVAIKVILGDYATDRDMRRRFAREARTIARLHHPHILPLIEFGDEQGILYLVMPYIDGGTLTSYLRRTLPDLGEVAVIYQQLLDAVEYAHDEGLIHRDIKSSNVLLELRRNAPPYVYLADFGLVRTLRPRAMDDSGQMERVGKPIPLDQVPGTPHYMAPEQTRGIVTPLTDIYALGVLLYQMLTGELPYNDDDDVRVIQMHMHDPIPSPCERDASIPVELGEVVRTAMAKRPEDRYENIAALRDAFLAALDGPAATTPEEGAPPDPVDPAGSEPTAAPPQAPPVPRRPSSTELPSASNRQDQRQDPPTPIPIVIPRRLRREAPVVALHDVRERREGRDGRDGRGEYARNAAHVPHAARVARGQQRTTENVRYRQRITEEPAPVKRRKGKRARPTIPIMAAMVVPVVLLILLLMPRALGISFFPSGFPLFGTPPVATIYVTAQSKTLQDRYVLTASPQVQAPDLTTHTIPDRVVQNTAAAGTSVQTTGNKTVAGVQARGVVFFLNNSDTPITIPAQTELMTAGGVQVQTVQDVQVPPHQNGQNGRASVPAIAVTPGVVGDIAAHTLDGPCCSDGITVRNFDPFSGGVDPQSVRVVAQADVDGVRNALAPKLEQQVLQQLQHQLASGEIMVGKPTYAVSASASSPVGSQATQVQIMINVTGSATVYNRDVAEHTAAQLLSQQATQTLGNGYQLRGLPTVTTSPAIQTGKNGIIYLSLSVRGLWVYALSSQQMSQWPQSIKGATSAAALAYLNAQPGVAGVEIHLPFGADHLPTDITEIKIVLVDISS